ncbi:MDR family MFS transporter [Petroclostridium sp. X23]|uniref:MDR family MFS transporter n=1 Tax=Petroclostridium sp. X23 TaxID=3045146 RepID=UPI0024ACF4AA|nr:MDR family MFS transporter [Petroclostridium sp. X23]WHH61086.1 MDR family MFS transporter [Petroclostridium sp. X23]
MELKKRGIVIAIMVSMFLAAFEGTVVTTAMPTIARDLKGFELISWVFSSYLFTSAIFTPIYGKLADMYGRKNTLFVGIIIFLMGSLLCGISQNMYQLIAFRAVQGIGAGSILPLTFAVIGDIFNVEQRAKVQGWLSSVWGIASLAGPFIGGYFIDYLSWHWIFFINIPFGILSVILLKKNLHEQFEKKKHKVDYLGTVVLTIAIISFLYGVLIGGQSNQWFSPAVTLSFIIMAVSLVVFYLIENRIEEPIMPFDIFTTTSTVINVISFLASAVLMGVEVYMAIYIQNVLGFNATISGLTMAPMSISWLLSAFILSKAISKYRERMIMIVFTGILVLSNVLLITVNIHSSLILVVIYVFVMGFGFGGCFTMLTMIVQSSVGFKKRGIATATNSLVRTLGQTIGVSVFGSILNSSIIRYFNGIGIFGIDPSKIYSASGLNEQISAEQVRISVFSGIHTIFVLLIIISMICLGLSIKIPSALPESRS